MKILVFLHGTILMHQNGIDKTREERVKQVVEKESSVFDYISYVPITNAVKKLQTWESEGSEIIYLSSHKRIEDVAKDKVVLEKHGFPVGQVLYRENNEEYKDIIERIVPDILIEDNCESIGGENKMSITYVSPEIKKKIKSIVVKEFEGIDSLPNDITQLLNFSND